MPEFVELACSHCNWTNQCGPGAMLRWLRDVRQVRRDAEPEPELLGELFRIAAPKYTCPKCAAVGLVVREVPEEDDEAWCMARPCESCRKPIPAERLEVFPNTRLCTACQAKSDRGELTGPAEYCPRCGSVMALRQSGGAGVTRYVMSCPSCRR